MSPCAAGNEDLAGIGLQKLLAERDLPHPAAGHGLPVAILLPPAQFPDRSGGAFHAHWLGTIGA
jgi:hypothetical protein